MSHQELKSSRIFFVDAHRTDDYVENGTLEEPYKTIQGGYDAAAALNPTQANPAAVVVFPGEYDENFIVDHDNVAVIAIGGQQVTNIRPSSGPAVIITNATRASVATFLANGGHADPAANYGDLVAGANTPRNVQIRDITLGKPGGSGYDLMALGVGAGTTFLGSELNIMRCCIWNETYLRLANYISMQGATWCAKKIVAYNIAGCWCNDSQITGYEGDYDAGSDEPSDSGNYGLCGGKTLNNGGIKLDGSARAGAGDPNGGLVLFQVAGNIDLNDTSQLVMAVSGIGGNIDAEAGAGFDLKGCHVQGNIGMADGVGVCQMDGGHYMGTLTDPGAKFTRNAGN